MNHPSPLGHDDLPDRAAPPSPTLVVQGIAAGLVSELRSPLSRIDRPGSIALPASVVAERLAWLKAIGAEQAEPIGADG